jgi:dienelactone hydrolase
MAGHGAVRWGCVLLVTCLIVACAPATTTASTAALPPSDARLAVAGREGGSVRSGDVRSTFGCPLRYEVHEPHAWRGGATVVLAHGFLRSLETMRGWAAHFASHGVRTVVVSFCNSTPFAGRHDRNAIDLRAVADEVRRGGGGIVYAGFSAGGLAALLAAADDPAALAYLGLDAVDSGGLATRASGWSGPSLFLAAEPSSCNAQGNMRGVQEVIARADVVLVPSATHCHFEDPYAPLCEVLCGRVSPPEAADAIRATIRSLATAFVLEHAGAR